jgi:L-fucose mutarotase/ribose pyranase (RbsD/FucU family)
MSPKFISGPPGTGKTNKFLTAKYLELLKKYSHNNIIVLSHTNVAADEIRDAILKLPEIKEKGLTKKSLKYKICTIHSFCKSRLVGRKEVFDADDHKNLGMINTLFKIQSIQGFDPDKHGFYKYLKDAFGRGYSDLKQFWKVCDRDSYKPYSINMIEEMEPIYIDYKKNSNVCDYDDMIKEFLDKAKEPDIDALIVDEAQDSNVAQTKALEKMSTNAKEYYMVGDADQTIFEFAGANADYYHKLSKEAEQLEQGYRCGETINKLCKSIIKPIWDHYGYDRVWKPAEGIVGNHYYLPSLKTKSSAIEKLLDKIENTKETFLFTFRGNPSDTWVKEFFKDHGIEFAHVGNTAHVPKKELKCHKLWPEFVKGKPMPLKQIKDFWTYIGSKVIVHGRGEETFDEWVNKDYTIDYLIHHKYLKENSTYQRDFSLIRTKTDSDRILYIQKILQRGFNLEGDVKVRYGNIHTVKGLTFDNVIVDLTATRIEDYFTQLRLKYVAYSRGKFDCWTISSQRAYTLGVR